MLVDRCVPSLLLVYSIYDWSVTLLEFAEENLNFRFFEFTVVQGQDSTSRNYERLAFKFLCLVFVAQSKTHHAHRPL